MKTETKKWWLAAALTVLGVGSAFFISGGVQAQNTSPLSRVAGLAVVSAYNRWVVPVATGNATTGSSSIQLPTGAVALADGRTIVPFTTTNSLSIDSGANNEVVTPTAVSGCYVGAQASPPSCTITATFAKIHGPGALVTSGSFGLQEAINDITSGVVTVDAAFGGTNATITGASGSAGVAVLDLRAGAPQFYTWNGAGYKASLAAAPSVSVTGPTTAIAATSCSSTVSTAAAGVTATSVLSWNSVAAPAAGYTSGLVENFWPTAGNINMNVCNPTAGSLTPGAESFTVRVIQF
jgi:hypothetical protein